MGAAAMALADKLLDLRPGYRLALHAQGIMQSQLTELATSELRPADALALGRRGEATNLTLVHLDSNNTVSWNNLAVIRKDLGDAAWAAGQFDESLIYYQSAIEAALSADKAGANFVLNQLYPMSVMAVRLADMGDAAADKTLAEIGGFVTGLHHSEPQGSVAPDHSGTVIWDSARPGLPTGVAISRKPGASVRTP